MSIIKIGYWKLRGRAQIPRLLLSYTNTPFEEKWYDFSNGQEWRANDKLNLGFDFPNLPYLIEGDFKLTETKAIIQYIIKKSGNKELLGKNVYDQGQINNLLGVLEDVKKTLGELIFNPKRQEAKTSSFEKIEVKLNGIKSYVGNNDFALGYLTLIDFYLAEVASLIELFYPNKKSEYGFLFRIRTNFNNVAGVQAYYNRPNAINHEVFPPFIQIDAKPNKVKLGYWQLRGLAQVPRLLLSYFGVDFDDIRYTNPDVWFKEDKDNLEIDFPNLPYLIDDYTTLTTNEAIQNYIINKWGNKQLLGKNIQDTARLDAFNAIFNEVAGAVRMLYFNPDYSTAKLEVYEKNKAKLEQLQKFVGGKEFVLGYLTVADFVVAEYSYYIQRLYPDQYSLYPFLAKVRSSFNKLPKVIAYYTKETSFHGRFFPEFAALSVQK